MNRRRTTAVIATAGALALSVLNAPAAQAKDTGIVVSNLVFNNGKPIVVGTSKVSETPVPFNIALPSGYTVDGIGRWRISPFLYRGNLKDVAKGTAKNSLWTIPYECYEQGSQRARCEGSLFINPDPYMEEVDSNSDATTWKIGVYLALFPAGDGPVLAEEYESRSGTVSLRRAAKLATADATPEPVTKGKKLTLKSKLTRANWTTKKNDAYAGSTVSLQFRAKNATSFKTLKKVKTNSAGALSTSVTATTDGFFRWVYYGNTTTGTATSGQDYIDVR
ncbi:hypothetical protein [Streptomyces sp. GQFP]|uniref:hypothetical protein n=1 Tax=Streptomyces sp. GQFP TaxID=2907545 RepID=UPI001F19AA9F|nr:hypothetical protein [Streptomyces sp. GQFP]UIX31479.1 hypothetical protein LUX31_16330 [Streptomyces sp. GQFP]